MKVICIAHERFFGHPLVMHGDVKDLEPGQPGLCDDCRRLLDANDDRVIPACIRPDCPAAEAGTDHYHTHDAGKAAGKDYGAAADGVA